MASPGPGSWVLETRLGRAGEVGVSQGPKGEGRRVHWHSALGGRGFGFGFGSDCDCEDARLKTQDRWNHGFTIHDSRIHDSPMVMLRTVSSYVPSLTPRPTLQRCIVHKTDIRVEALGSKPWGRTSNVERQCAFAFDRALGGRAVETRECGKLRAPRYRPMR